MNDSNNKQLPVNAAMRVAVVDLLFCWPPNGGADVDIYNVAATLHARGVDVRMFVLQFDGVPGRGQVAADAVPFPLEVITVPQDTRDPGAIADAVRAQVDKWAPTAVFLAHGYALKPWIALALSHYPLVGRYYAHELLCARNALRFREGASCSTDYLRRPDRCRRCAIESLGPEIRSGTWQAWTQDFVIAGAHTPRYYDTARQALDAMTRIIVSNNSLRQEMGQWRDKTMVIPGGVQAEAFTQGNDAEEEPQAQQKKIIFMAGRAEDPLKGLEVLLAAGTGLAKKRSDFHIRATHFDTRRATELFSATGWLSQEETRAHYRQAAICVVPSLWHEPFGLVAVEAMAAGRPVCASDSGGLRDIVVHEETGFLFPPGDADALAGALERLLDSPALCQRMGRAGQERARTLFTWDAVIDRHYLPLLHALEQERDDRERK